MRIDQGVAERFWKYVPDQPGDDCWEWAGSKRPAGYGQLSINRRPAVAHRISYALCRGDPAGLFVCHACDNPGCVNPNHLFLGTPLDNMRDMVRKGRRPDRPNGREQRTHCPAGHHYNDKNTYIRPNGWRTCIACQKTPEAKAAKLANQRRRRRVEAADRRASFA